MKLGEKCRKPSEMEGLTEGLARMSWKGRPHPSSCRWASSSQDHRPDSSRVVYDDVPYEKVQVSVALWLALSHHCGSATEDALGSLGQAATALRVFQHTLPPVPAAGRGGAGAASRSPGEAPCLLLQREVAAGGPASESEEARVE